MPAPHRDRDLVATGYRYVARTGIFRVAAIDEQLAALACATLRGTQWFLSGFWTHPSVRLRGIGGPLLREVWDEGARRGARSFYVWSSPDHPAIASYMKLGMLPGTQLFAFAGEPRTGPPTGLAFRGVPFTTELVAPLDRDVVGVERDADHEYWLAREGGRASAVTSAGGVVGYYHVHHGTIGPIAWSRDEFAETVLWSAIRDAASDSQEVQLTVPGSNHAAIRYALGTGLRLIRTSHLLWTSPIGHMERYVPSGPLLF